MARPSTKLVFLLKTVLWVAAIVLSVWALRAPGLRTADGSISGAPCLFLSIAAALLVVGATAGSALQRAGLWTALAITGQAAVLQLIVAGPVVGYQHLTLRGGAPLTRPALFIAAVQAVLVVFLGAPVWRAAVARARSWTSPAVLAVCAFGFVLLSATLSRSPVVFGAETLAASGLQLIAFLNVLLVVRALPANTLERVSAWSQRWLGSSSEIQPGGVDRFAVVCALWAVLVAALFNVLVYQRHPHIPDEVSYLWQARYFAHGSLAMPAPPVPEAFNLDLMTYEAARWYSPFPLGWPAGLAIGVLVGAPWLVNPVLTGICLLLMFVFLRDIYPVRTARLATILLALSPWFLFMGMSFMAHAFTLAFALAAAVCVARGRRTGAWLWALPAGVAAGIVSLARPLDGLLVAGLLGLWWLLPRLGVRRIAGAFLFGVVAAGVGALTLPYNRALTGNSHRHPVMDYFDRVYGPGVNDLGFGANRGVGWTGLDPFPGHGIKDVIVNAQLNASVINVDLFGWATGSLLLVFALLALGKRRQHGDRLMLLTVLGVIALQSLYWFSGGPDIGARYWYLTIVPLVVLSARGLEAIAERWRADSSVLAAVGVLCFLAVVSFLPWRAMDKYYHFRSMRPDIRTLARAHGFDHALVLVRGKRHPDYASAATYNPLEWSSAATLYAWDRGADVRERVLKAFPDRPVWIVNGPTITGHGYEVVAGPIPPGAPLPAAVAAYSPEPSAQGPGK